MKYKITHIFLVSLFLLVDLAVFAQPGDDTGDGGLENNDPPPAPIDSELIWLVIIALVFAFYSFRKYRKVT
jgi:hypothetical protein